MRTKAGTARSLRLTHTIYYHDHYLPAPNTLYSQEFGTEKSSVGADEFISHLLHYDARQAEIHPERSRLVPDLLGTVCLPQLLFALN